MRRAVVSIQLMEVGRRGRRGRTAAQTVSVIDVELATTQRHRTTVSTATEPISTRLTAPEDSAQVGRLNCSRVGLVV